MNSAISQTASAITSQVSQTLTNYYTSQQTDDAIDGSIGDALQNYSTTTEMNSAISQTASEITTEVNKKVGYTELGTKIQQNSESVRIAWNNHTQYIKLESSQLNIYDATNKLISFNSSGEDIYYKGTYVGCIGSGYWKIPSNTSDTSKRGLEFRARNGAAYVGWSIWDGSVYSEKLWYTAVTLPNSAGQNVFASDNLHTGCDMDFHNHYLKNPVMKDWGFDGGTLSGTISGLYATSYNSDGTAATWRSFSLTFNRGILKSASW